MGDISRSKAALTSPIPSMWFSEFLLEFWKSLILNLLLLQSINYDNRYVRTKVYYMPAQCIGTWGLLVLKSMDLART